MHGPRRTFLTLSPYTRRFAVSLLVAWSLAAAGVAVWTVLQERQYLLGHALVMARVAWDKDIIYRKWNASHGGVYVPVTPQTQPNPYLAGMAERDIVAPSGRPLTLINPAYMSRQVFEMEGASTGTRSHLTSLRPLRPENAPDPWEREALTRFERGEREVRGIAVIEGREFLRVMKPFATEESCLRCHAAQGYRVGDIRGGLSVAVPLAPIWAARRRFVAASAAGVAGLWLLGLVGLWRATRRLGRNEREVRAAMDEAQAASNAKSRFLAGVSHEFRTPLNAILGFGQLLQSQVAPGLSQTQREQVGHIVESGRHLLLLVEDILELTAEDAGTTVPETSEAPVGELLRQVAAELGPAADRKSVSIDVQAPETLGIAKADPPRLRRVVRSLLSNAVRLTPEGGRVGVVAEPAGGGVRITVWDEGEGIPEAEGDRIFHAFEQGAGAMVGRIGGVGLGLAVAKKLVELQGGTIRLESEPGHGSRFIVELPGGADEGA